MAGAGLYMQLYCRMMKECFTSYLSACSEFDLSADGKTGTALQMRLTIALFYSSAPLSKREPALS